MECGNMRIKIVKKTLAIQKINFPLYDMLMIKKC